MESTVSPVALQYSLGLSLNVFRCEAYKSTIAHVCESQKISSVTYLVEKIKEISTTKCILHCYIGTVQQKTSAEIYRLKDITYFDSNRHCKALFFM